ncbi:hypothetical protein ACIGNX_22470 [Actinosynnema sp. NPDC053489]|uniref:hypothetical protein n=1 Tax=Actinosynnema sp. NPDC053489 TaxID=3363916 RepID=UPI0037C4F5EB
MRAKSFLRKLTLSVMAVAALGTVSATAASADTASPVRYGFTLCNYADEFHVFASFAKTGIKTNVAWTNQCITSTHLAGETIYIHVVNDKSGYATKTYAIPSGAYAQQVTTKGTYSAPSVVIPAR